LLTFNRICVELHFGAARIALTGCGTTRVVDRYAEICGDVGVSIFGALPFQNDLFAAMSIQYVINECTIAGPAARDSGGTSHNMPSQANVDLFVEW